MCRLTFALAGALLGGVAAGQEMDAPVRGVVELRGPSDVASVVGKGKAVLVYAYAPWCDLCKQDIPLLRELAQVVRFDPHARDHCVVAKVDLGRYGELIATFENTHYPQLVYFDATSNRPSNDYHGPRTMDRILSFLNSKDPALSLVAPKRKPDEAKLAVLQTDAAVREALESVSSAADGPACLVLVSQERGAGWPSVLASVFARERAVALAAADFGLPAVAGELLVAAGGADSACVAARGRAPAPGRTSAAFAFGDDPTRFSVELVAWVNEQCGTHRLLDGTLSSSGGRIAELDQLVKGAALSEETLASAAKHIENVYLQAQHSDDDLEHASLYKRILSKALGAPKPGSWLENEYSRLKNMLHNDEVKSEKVDAFTKRVNILRVILDN
ncbi:Protein disulfide-isomerase erp38 [Diplonema papillatum]|nr:Protein disulfide-isomerase erp38 [Diplonema papillatum]KAJ9464807.1 Protein disulfide-isomerase erp38 [Diplonema papillatum]